jgi:hypothetical protein
MRIVNNSWVPDKIVEKFVLAAKRGIGMSFSIENMVFEVRTARSWSHGVANGRVTSRVIGRGKQREWQNCPDGWVCVWLRKPQSKFTDPLDTAENIYGLIAHELRHIADGQDPEALFQYFHKGGRRLIWRNRPHEKRAIHSEKVARERYQSDPKIQDAILECGVVIEEMIKNQSVVVKKVRVY